VQDYRSPIRPRASAVRKPNVPVPATPDIEEDDSYYRSPAIGNSALRYTTTEGIEVLRQGNRQFIVHHGKPPKKKHWLFFVGMGMLVMFLLWVSLSAFVNWWGTHQVDAKYGNPRTWQIDEVVGHSDSSMHPTHFIFENLHTHVIFIEIPGGDVTHARIYSVTTLFGDNADQTPVTASFADVNGDGKIDILIHIGDQTIIFVNTGTQFQPQ
jgi:hypothetical protein